MPPPVRGDGQEGLIMWLVDLLACLLGLFGVAAMAAGVWGITQNRKDNNNNSN